MKKAKKDLKFKSREKVTGMIYAFCEEIEDEVEEMVDSLTDNADLFKEGNKKSGKEIRRTTLEFKKLVNAKANAIRSAVQEVTNSERGEKKSKKGGGEKVVKNKDKKGKGKDKAGKDKDKKGKGKKK